MPGSSRRHRHPGLAWVAAGLLAAVLAVALAAAPALAQPADPDEPVDVAELLAELDLFPDGQLDEQRLASFTSALSRAEDGSVGVTEAARSLAAAAQQFQHIRESEDPMLREAYIAALSAALDEALVEPGHPQVRENLDRLAAQVQQYGSLTSSGSDGGSVREAPGDAIANRRGPALALIGLALAALAIGVIRLSVVKRERQRAE